LGPCYIAPMNDQPKDDANETPAQRALRMRKAALGARSHPSGASPLGGKAVAGMKAGLSKPPMRK
jgi:hypothetical protein